MYRKILVATDASDTSTRAAGHALGLAQALGAEVVALSVVDTRTLAGALPFRAEYTAAWELAIHSEWKKAAAAAADEVAGRGPASGVHVAQEVVEGVPATTILEVAKRVGADLIVMGTHGRTGVSALLMGSTAQSVLHGTHVPVLLVR